MLAAVGDSCVDRYLPPVDRTTAGGNALNVAANLAARGHRTAYAGSVGDDADGRLIRRAAQAAGLDLRHLSSAPGVTGVCLVRLRADGEREFVSERTGVSGAYRPSPAAVQFLDGCEWVHAAGLAVGEPLLPRLRSRRRSYDFSTHDPDRIQALAPHVDVAFLSGAGLDRGQAAALARAAVAAGAGSSVVTRGRHGSLAAWEGGLVEQPAEPVEVVDTLGAGDALIAAVISARVGGADLDQALAEGARAAAAACTHLGAWSA
ncbi:MAG TPA: PfkB family carbohydrate kinase [Gaiellales bacterium]|jgi:fructoselysine 6-kinase|nr:PfkB family carbohydrate kinase [Gaiellales bacterium]